jgi:hypothetical protein
MSLGCRVGMLITARLTRRRMAASRLSEGGGREVVEMRWRGAPAVRWGMTLKPVLVRGCQWRRSQFSEVAAVGGAGGDRRRRARGCRSSASTSVSVELQVNPSLLVGGWGRGWAGPERSKEK